MVVVSRIFTGLCFVALAATAGFFFLQTKIDSAAISKMETEINQCLIDANMTAELGDVKFIEGKGFRISDLRISDLDAPGQPVLEMYSVFAHMPITVADLLVAEAKPSALSISRAKLRVIRRVDGTTNLAQLLQHLQEIQPPQSCGMPIRISDSSIQFFDAANNQSIELDHVSINLQQVEFKGRSLNKVEVSLGGDHIRELKATVYLDLKSKTWFTDIQHSKVTVSSDLLAWIPATWKENLHISTVYGQVNCSGKIQGRIDAFQTIPTFKLSGDVNGFSLKSSRLPLAITGVKADWIASDQGFQVHNANGSLGKGKFNVSYSQTGLVSRQAWSVNGQIDEIAFDEKMLDPFPEYCKKFCREYDPGGSFNIDFNLNSDGKREIFADLTDMSFTYYRFPFRINNCVGQVNWIDDICKFNVRALEGKQILKFDGHIRNPGKKATYECNIETVGDLPIDEKLVTAIAGFPRVASAVRSFRASGRVSVKGNVAKRNHTDRVALKVFDIDIRQCSVRHTKFDYPMHNVNGTIRMRNQNFTFDNFRGTNNSVNATCNGVWNETDGLRLRFICNSVPLDEQLRSALPAKIREIWDGFRPSGTVAIGRVDLDLPTGERDVDIVINADLQGESSSPTGSVAIRPTWFPYQLNDLSGQIFIGHGKVRGTDILGKHGRAWTSFQGNGSYDDSSWAVTLSKFLSVSVPVDEDLIRAFPQPLAASVRNLQYQGQINVEGTLQLSGTHAQPENNVVQVAYPLATRDTDTSGVKIGWDLRFDMAQTQVNLGVPLKNIFGSFRLFGQHQNNETLCRGSVAIDSFTLYGIQVTNLKGPIWIDNSQALAGIFSSSFDQTNQRQSLVGDVFGGQVRFDGQVRFEENNTFFIQTSLGQSKLDEIAADIAPQFRDISGSGYATLKLTGNSLSQDSVRGQGNIQLRDAKIYKLPVILALLKILRIKQATRTAFDAGNIDFSVFGERIELNRIEFIGDAISLLGNGTMNLQRDVDLNFYTVYGRNRFYIPLFSELMHSGAQQILWINVNGKLDDPKTRQEILPKLNESLRQLFKGTSFQSSQILVDDKRMSHG